jgi:hypothetical protein
VSKELRETAGIAVLGLAVLLSVAVISMGWSPLPGILPAWGRSSIPFVGDSFVNHFGIAAFGLAAVLGFRQAVADFSGDAQQVLLHLPIPRERIYLTKLAVGLATYLACSVAPIALYAAWAATPGTHASPFEWSMTGDAWLVWLAMTAVYLGAFLSGIRPAAWLGTRLAPLAASLIPLGVITLFSLLLVVLPWALGLLFLLAFDVLLIVLIVFVVQTRDFA